MLKVVTALAMAAFLVGCTAQEVASTADTVGSAAAIFAPLLAAQDEKLGVLAADIQAVSGGVAEAAEEAEAAKAMAEQGKDLDYEDWAKIAGSVLTLGGGGWLLRDRKYIDKSKSASPAAA